MTDLSLKDQGNDEFKKGNFLKAAGLYSKAIKEDSNNAVLYSNRCAALLKLNKVGKALEDAEHCIRLKPDWDKGYFRKGSALEASLKYKEALAAYQESVKRNPDNSEVSSKIRTLSKFIRTLDKQTNSTGSSASKAENGSSKNSTGSSASKSAPAARPASDPEIESFRQEWLEHALEHAADSNLEPSVHFLPGTAEATNEEELNVKAKSAFDSPDVFGQFCGFLSSHREKLAARAICAVLPKSVVSFPTVWKKTGWPCGQDDGIFLQTMAAGYRQIAFIPVQQGKPKAPVELDTDFAVLPWSLLQ